MPSEIDQKRKYLYLHTVQTNFEKQSFPTTLLDSTELEKIFYQLCSLPLIHAIISKL